MKTTKRLLALNLVLVLLLTLVPAAALADVVMKLDEYVSFTKEENSEENAVFTFTPDTDGEYRIDVECPYMNVSGESLVLFAQGDGEPRKLYADNISDTVSITDEETGEWHLCYSISFPYELQAGVEYKLSFGIDPNGQYKAKVFYLGEATTVVEINATNFPDEVFRQYVLVNCDFNGDGKLSKNEIANVETMNVYNSNIESLEGIKNFTSLKTLRCFGNKLTELPELPVSLTYLECSGNQLTEMLSLPESLEILSCRGNQITALPELPESLNSLNCSDNPLTVLPALPEKLEYLNCSNNQITALPELPESLNSLDCSDNQLTEPLALPEALEYLYCSNNQLSVLPSLPETLKRLNCSSNQLTVLPALPEALEYLNCEYNNLTSLPKLPDSLTELDCSLNQLPVLPELPNGLAYLYCSSNQLTALPETLPAELTYLDCSVNKLTSINAISSLTKLYKLQCSNNDLTALSELPESLNWLYCYNNKLTELPTLPASLSWLYCWNNQLTRIELNSNADYYGIDVSGNSLPDYDAVTGKNIKWGEWDYIFGEQNHEHDCVEEVTEAATCSHGGWKAVTCTKCGYYSEEWIQPIPHEYGDNNWCQNCGIYKCETDGSHKFNDAHQCTMCGGYECMEENTLHEFDNEGVCSICGNSIPEPYTGEDGSVWTLAKDGVLTISGANDDVSYWDAIIHFEPFLQNTLKIVCEDGTTFFRGYYKFYNVKEIHFGRDVKTVTHPSSLFSLETITVDDENPYLCAVDGVLYSKDGSELLIYPLYLGGSLSSSVTVKDGVENIGIRAFYNNYALKSAILPDGLENIKDEAFIYCGDLKTVYIPSTVTNIGWRAFFDCENIADVYFSGTEEQWNEITIGEGNENLTDAEIHYGHQHEYVAVETVEATCWEVGYTAGTKCACGLIETGCEEIAKLDHQPITIEKIAPTCTDIGWTEYVKCEKCRYLISGREEIPALGHDFQNDTAKAPTCTEPGYTGSGECTRCGETIVGGEIPATGHTEVVNERAVAATCTKAGNTESRYCAVCGAVTATSEVIPAKGHQETRITGARTATCDMNGYTGDTVCIVCDEVVESGETIPALGHSYTEEVTAPTCTDGGYTKYTCSVCGSWDYDNWTDPLGHSFVNGVCTVCGAEDSGETPTHTHSYTETVTAPTCTEKGYTTHTCACGDSYEDSYVPAKGHTEVTDEAVKATCTKTGLTEGKHCSACGEILTAQEVTPVYAHDYVNGECTVCHAIDPDYVEPVRPSYGHSHSYAATVTAPTCTEKGYTTYKCSCGSSFVGSYVDAKGHTEVTDAAVAATCTATGLTEGKHCSECNEIFVKQEVVPALAHDYKDGVCTVCKAKDPSVNPFKDVAETSPYADAISWAYANDITKGKTDDSFGVNDGCTRAQIVTLLWREAGSPAAAADTVNPFTDVSADSEYYDAIMWAIANGITYGTTTTTFSPDAVCTRGQIVTFMYRAAGSPKVSTGTGFTDVDESSYCCDAVAWAVANGITNGKTDTTFAPSETCTRGQAVTFMYRASANK